MSRCSLCCHWSITSMGITANSLQTPVMAIYCLVSTSSLQEPSSQSSSRQSLTTPWHQAAAAAHMKLSNAGGPAT